MCLSASMCWIVIIITDITASLLWLHGVPRLPYWAISLFISDVYGLFEWLAGHFVMSLCIYVHLLLDLIIVLRRMRVEVQREGGRESICSFWVLFRYFVWVGQSRSFPFNLKTQWDQREQKRYLYHTHTHTPHNDALRTVHTFHNNQSSCVVYTYWT